MRKMSQAGINLLKSLEGLRLEAYLDQHGVWTIGFGHTGPDINPLSKITEQDAEDLLSKDLCWAETGVDNAVKVDLTDNEFSALVIFTYNVGLTAFKLSTLLNLLNRGVDKITVAQEFDKWNKIAGVPNQGLTNRRQREKALFLTPTQTT